MYSDSFNPICRVDPTIYSKQLAPGHAPAEGRAVLEPGSLVRESGEFHTSPHQPEPALRTLTPTFFSVLCCFWTKERKGC